MRRAVAGPTRVSLPRLLSSRRRRRFFVQLIAAGFVEAGLAVAAAFLVTHSYRALLGDGEVSPPGLALLGPVGLGFVAFTVWALRGWQLAQAERLAQHYIKRVRLLLFEAITVAGRERRVIRASGPHMVRFASDLTAVRQWVAQGAARLAVAGVAGVAGLALLPYLDATVGGAALSILVTPVALAVFLGSRYRRRADAARRARNRLAANIGDKIAGATAVLAFRQGTREARRLARQSDALSTAMVARSRVAGWLRALPDLAVPLAGSAVLATGPSELAAGRTDVGTLLAIMTVLGLLARPLSDLARVIEFWHAFQISRGRIEPALTVPRAAVRRDPGHVTAAGPARVTFEQVTVEGALDGVTATAEPGALVAVVGPSGAGKSALLGVVAGLITPSKGRVLIDGRDAAGLAGDDVRRIIGVASPDVPLQRGSIRRNLRYRAPDASPAEIARVVTRLGVDRPLSRLRDGDATRMTEGGRGLPSGFRQAVSLARALIGRPRVLLLDDPHQDLDPRTRARLDAILAEREATTLVATNELALARTADRIWYLEDGRIEEQGSAADLLSSATRTAQFFGLSIASSGAVIVMAPRSGR